MLDQIDGDENMEADRDDEPWLGWTATGAHGNRRDLEIGEREHVG